MEVQSLIDQIQKLTPEEIAHVREFVTFLQWRDRTQAGQATKRSAPAHEAMQWIDEHRAQFAGQWVAMDGARLIASGPDARAVYKEARSQGIEVPFVDKVVAVEPEGIWGGWL